MARLTIMGRVNLPQARDQSPRARLDAMLSAGGHGSRRLWCSMIGRRRTVALGPITKAQAEEHHHNARDGGGNQPEFLELRQGQARGRAEKLVVEIAGDLRTDQEADA